MKSAAILVGMTLGMLVLAACAGSPGTAPGTADPAATAGLEATPAAAQPVSVSIVDFGFEPADATVARGGTVSWVNTGQAPHTVKWSDGEPESAQLANGDEYERTFDTPGTFDYICGVHPDIMAGSVTVGE